MVNSILRATIMLVLALLIMGKMGDINNCRCDEPPSPDLYPAWGVGQSEERSAVFSTQTPVHTFELKATIEQPPATFEPYSVKWTMDIEPPELYGGCGECGVCETCGDDPARCACPVEAVSSRVVDAAGVAQKTHATCTTRFQYAPYTQELPCLEPHVSWAHDMDHCDPAAGSCQIKLTVIVESTSPTAEKYLHTVNEEVGLVDYLRGAGERVDFTFSATIQGPHVKLSERTSPPAGLVVKLEVEEGPATPTADGGISPNDAGTSTDLTLGD